MAEFFCAAPAMATLPSLLGLEYPPRTLEESAPESSLRLAAPARFSFSLDSPEQHWVESARLPGSRQGGGQEVLARLPARAIFHLPKGGVHEQSSEYRHSR